MNPKKDRKNDIRKAVMKIVETHGIQGLKTARIAKEVGFTEAALYKHFKNKDAILEFVLDERLAVTKRNKQVVAEMDLDPIECTIAFFKKADGIHAKKSRVIQDYIF